MEKHRQLELVRQTVAHEQAFGWLLRVLAKLRDRCRTCLHRRLPAEKHQEIDAKDQRYMRDHRPENGGLVHGISPLAKCKLAAHAEKRKPASSRQQRGMAHVLNEF